MKLTVNGNAHEHDGGATVKGLLDAMGIEQTRVAVMVNGHVIRRQDFAAATLSAGDVVEILTFAGGG